MDLKEIIRGLVNSEDNTGCAGGLTVVEHKWVRQLKKYLDKLDQEEQSILSVAALNKNRERIAQGLFESSNLDGLQCIDSDGWEKDGEDIYIKKFYYEDEENPEGDSKTATYTITFKKNSGEVLDEGVNVW